MAKITIIIPVYNAALSLKRCIESIRAQTYSFFDLILINDGSVDGSAKICDEYVKEDSRIHVIHQNNRGPSAARNAGIEWSFEYSESNYLAFIDSDDCIHATYLERLYCALIDNDAEISACKHRYIPFMASFEEESCDIKNHEYTISAEDLMVMQGSDFNYAWAKLFLKDCFKEVRFPEKISFGEDNLIIYKVLFGCDKIVYIEDALYYYFYNQNGITKSPWNPKNLDCFKGIQAQMDYYLRNGYLKAYNKECELYIQQYAYQIHRIREDKKNLTRNRGYLVLLTKEMRALFRKHSFFSIQDNHYWYEALYPRKAYIRQLYVRVLHNYRKAGFKGMVNKIIRKIRNLG